MKLVKIGALGLLTTGSLSAQGIFNTTPNDTVLESLPLEYKVSVNFGWDDNVTPTVKEFRGEDSVYTSVNLGANYVNRGPQTSVDFHLTLGVKHYFDNVSGEFTPVGSTVARGFSLDDTYYKTNFQFNVAHSVSERLRYSSRNYLFYGLEPDYNYGVVNDRVNDEYLYFSTDNSVGYKWTDRLGSYTGVKYDILDYTSRDSRNDRETFTLYNQMRYVGSQQAVYTLDYRYSMSSGGSSLDSTNNKLLAGIEYRISPTAIAVGKVGIQHRKVDGRDAQTEPTFELSYVQRVNESFKLRGSASYEVNDFGTSLGAGTFDDNKVFRLSVAGDYYVSPQLFFTAGVNQISNDYVGDGIPDEKVDITNVSIGATFKMKENLSANVNYNYTNSDDSGDALSRDYSRSRVQTGLTLVF